MAIYTRRDMSPAKEKELAVLKYENERLTKKAAYQGAMIDYLAVMADIEIPEEEEDVPDGEDEV